MCRLSLEFKVFPNPFQVIRKFLELNWDTEKDTFIFRFDLLVGFAKELPLNKCTVLKVVANTQLSGFMTLLTRNFLWGTRNGCLICKAECIPSQQCYLPDERVISLQLHSFEDSSEVVYAVLFTSEWKWVKESTFICWWVSQESYCFPSKQFPGLSS